MRPKHEVEKLTKFELSVLEKLDKILLVLGEGRNGDFYVDDPVTLEGLSEQQWSEKDEKNTRVRKSKLPIKELTSRRDLIIKILEPHCPEIIEGLQNARNEAEAARAIEISELRSSSMKPGFLQDPQRSGEFLWGFLRSRRFHGNLRNLANAMAGVPEMSWKRSFDLCTAHPPDPPIDMHFRAYRDFLQRNFPERLGELDSAKTSDEVAKVLAKSRSKNPTYLKLKESPDWVLRWVKEGIVKNPKDH